MATSKDVMSNKVLTANSNIRFDKLMKVFVDMGIHHIPITNENGSLEGIVSSTDALKAYHEMEYVLQRNGVSVETKIDLKEILTRDVITISPDTKLSKVVRLMVENAAHALPVLEDGELVGILSAKDILSAIADGKLRVASPDEYYYTT